MNYKNKVYLSMGSNLGNTYYYLLSGIFKIAKLKSTFVSKISKFYSTEPVGYLDQGRFLNCAIEIETDLLPLELLCQLQRIELELKRERKVKWGPRTLDIDIIFFNDCEISTEELTVPHREYQNRNFVLIPLRDILCNKSIVDRYIKENGKDVVLEDKKNILISTCLLGFNTTYKGSNSNNYIVSKLLKDKFNFVKVCPEVEGGLSIPRLPSERVGDRVIQNDGVDITPKFIIGSEIALKKAVENKAILGIFKSKSPSCGLNNIYDGTFSGKLIAKSGVTTERLLNNGFDIIEVDRDER